MDSARDFSFDLLEPAPPVRVLGSPADELAQARAEAADLRATARREGYEEGYAAGRAEALADCRPAAAALVQAGSVLRAQGEAAAERLEGQAVAFSLDLAEKVVAAALPVRPELVLDAVRHALRGIVERRRVSVLVHPDDLPHVSEAMAGLQGELGGIEHWEVQGERRVSRGGALVRHSEGEVDAQVATKLRRAREVVEAALEDGR